jgi:hypothetical protein
MVECGLQLIWPEHWDKYVRDEQNFFLTGVESVKKLSITFLVFHILLRFFRKLIADKHSTGGIGDKVKINIGFQTSIETDWSKINLKHSIVN